VPRIIKRYDNRKLYDLEARHYVRLSDLAKMIHAGEEIVVTDNATGEDLTAQTLTKVLSDESAGRPLLPEQSLHDLVRLSGGLKGRGSRDKSNWFERWIAHSVERATATREALRELKELRDRVATLESVVMKLEKENENGGNDDNHGHGRGGRDT
jgi:polyhydroxyalkanoate synthesis repressor PhaR